MQTIKFFAIVMLTGFILAVRPPVITPSGMSNATFSVRCYDVGAKALYGKTGVVSVERGWRGAREVDRVFYDPQQVTLGQLENWLKQADTYISTFESPLSGKPVKEMTQ
jgi:hypothetical protein